MAALSGIGRTLGRSGNVSTAAVLSSIYIYARLQGVGGQTLAAPSTGSSRSLRSAIAGNRLARRQMRFKMRDGARLRCRIVDGGGILSVYVDGDYDLPGLDWGTVSSLVDLGAHIGTFTVWAALRAPAARCLAVEPNPVTYPLLVQNVRDNGLDARVKTLNAAVSDSLGTGTLELVEHSLGTRLARDGDGTAHVDLITLPALLEEARIETVDLLKMDIEGKEYDVVMAMPREILSRVRNLACEYHPEQGHDVKELEQTLAAGGFKVTRPPGTLGVLWATR